MKVTLIEEAGYESAMRGSAPNKRQPVENMPKVALRLVPKGEPHCKFLRQMYVWFEITAPCYETSISGYDDGTFRWF